MTRRLSKLAPYWHYAHGAIIFAALVALVELSQWDGWY